MSITITASSSQRVTLARQKNPEPLVQRVRFRYSFYLDAFKDKMPIRRTIDSSATDDTMKALVLLLKFTVFKTGSQLTSLLRAVGVTRLVWWEISMRIF